MPAKVQGQSLEKDHYAILSLPSPLEADRPPPSQQEIKQAYHQALLRYHPDKASAAQVANRESPTIDRLTIAYKTLANQKARASYNRQLFLMARDLVGPRPLGDADAFKYHSGIEYIDLEDMAFDESRKKYYRTCRCGRSAGFNVEEAQLEEHEEDGEILLECHGCSLWLRVGFSVDIEG